MISLAQMILVRDNQSTVWTILRIFTYFSISANLVAAGSAIWGLIYLAWMPLSAATREQILFPGSGEQYWETYERALSMVRTTPNFSGQYTCSIASYGTGLILTFITVLTWVWVSMSRTEGIALSVFVAPGLLCIAWPLLHGVYFTFRGENPWMVTWFGW
jgi:hypothetical protein